MSYKSITRRKCKFHRTIQNWRPLEFFRQGVCVCACACAGEEGSGILENDELMSSSSHKVSVLYRSGYLLRESCRRGSRAFTKGNVKLKEKNRYFGKQKTMWRILAAVRPQGDYFDNQRRIFDCRSVLFGRIEAFSIYLLFRYSFSMSNMKCTRNPFSSEHRELI